jgi:hypothetical protein
MHVMSDEEWKAFVVAEPRNAVPGELLVRLRPAHLVAQAGIAD